MYDDECYHDDVEVTTRIRGSVEVARAECQECGALLWESEIGG